jgi:hypothetical protein
MDGRSRQNKLEEIMSMMEINEKEIEWVVRSVY